jgi:hypothetical protein
VTGGYYIDGDGVVGFCVAGDSNCTKFINDGSGLCEECLPVGFELINGTCVDPPALPFVDPNCALVSNLPSNNCLKCYSGYYINGNGISGICTYGSTECATFTTVGNGLCATCWSSYILAAGACLLPSTIDPNCAQFYPGLTFCKACYSGYYIGINGVTGKCTLGSTSCATFTTTGNGACKTCWAAYLLVSGNCLLPSSVDPNCALFVPGSTFCQKCYSGYYIGVNGVTGKCTLGSYTCATFTTNGSGACASCWPSYNLVAGTCGLSANNDPYCAQFAPFPSTNCVRCYSGYYINGNGVTGKCTLGSSSCASFTTVGNGLCASCWASYTLTAGACLLVSNGDLYCAQFAPLPSTNCVRCYQGYYINGNGVTGKCTLGSYTCASFTTVGNGLCASCWPSYILSAGNCILPASLDPYCSQFVPSTTTCLSCYAGYYVNTPGTGKCLPANLYCGTYNMIGGACTSCWSPYRLSGLTPNTCIYP